ncbi:phosphatidate cytidylyltransferase 1-like [Zophobas morio]|uniref:phosphatidate cytidylyltransferase 1-like n=1 Tax=Zophobas morio TaxID=2755281 RepID=UPI003082A69D
MRRTYALYFSLFWLVISVIIIRINNCSSYFFGFFFGRTSLIELSPKKTLEGFVGGLIFTLLVTFLAAGTLAKYDYFVCPVEEMSLLPNYDFHCERHDRFIPYRFSIPAVFPFSLLDHVDLYPVQLDALVLSLFGSVVAPFGGFFVSGFKRAFNVKDFDDLILGRGGLVANFDSQLLLGTFTYVYYGSFFSTIAKVIANVNSLVLNDLDVEHQIKLLKVIEKNLENK